MQWLCLIINVTENRLESAATAWKYENKINIHASKYDFPKNRFIHTLCPSIRPFRSSGVSLSFWCSIYACSGICALSDYTQWSVSGSKKLDSFKNQEYNGFRGPVRPSQLTRRMLLPMYLKSPKIERPDHLRGFRTFWQFLSVYGSRIPCDQPLAALWRH